MRFPVKLRTASLALLLLAGACVPTVQQHGQRIDPEAVARIRPGVTSREEVLRLMGSPSATATFDDRRWYYVTQTVEKKSFYQKRLADQRVVIVEFDDRGIVRNLEERGLEQARAVEPVADKTPTMGNEFSLLEQLIGNIGRFSRNAENAGR
ncbi:MAG TPA: outer membrane protein assembly factor BamE [Rhodospirillales bacterium]|nr:outer membrane protein assembly factor BamE [Rhodospirillales bacterium]